MRLRAVMRSVAMSIVGRPAFNVKWVRAVFVAFVLLLCRTFFIVFFATLILMNLSDPECAFLPERGMVVEWYSIIRHSVDVKVTCRFPKNVLLVKAQMLQPD